MERQLATEHPLLPQPPAESDAPDAHARAERSFAHVMAILERLSRALNAPVTGQFAPTATELRDAVCDCVAQLKAQGMPPERVLARMKGLARETVAAGTSRRDAEERVAQVAQWCIRAYDLAD